MRLRRIIALFILAVYTTCIAGYSYTILTCQCHHSSEHVCHEKGCCHSSPVCHQSDTSTAGLISENRCHCKHSHSTEIELYDIQKKQDNIHPLVSDCEPAHQTCCNDLLKQAKIPFDSHQTWGIPLPGAPLPWALRAPPALA